MHDIRDINFVLLDMFYFLCCVKRLLTIILILSLYQIANSQKFSAEFHLGYADNIPSNLVIKQKGFPDTIFTAHYYSEPFVSPYYWLWRISYKRNEKCKFEFEAVHHKIYLKNTNNVVEAFGISHGLNLLMFNYVKILTHNFHLNYGIGGVLSHPESTIRGQSLPEKKRGIFGMGYYLSGIVMNFSAGKYFILSDRFYINTEIRFNPSYSVVPIVNGKAYVWNYSYQLIGGIGYFFISATKCVLKNGKIL